MKITLNHSKFSKALTYVSRAVSQKQNIPILSNVLLEVDKTDLLLSATNLDMAIKISVPGFVEKEGKITAPAKYLADFVVASFSEKILLELTDNNLKVSSDKAKANFNIIPASEFPVLPKVNKVPVLTISVKEFLISMDKVLFSCSTELIAGKIQQTGVLFEVNKEEASITFVGLDGFRLSKREAKLKGVDKNTNFPEMIVSAKYLADFVKVVEDSEESTEIDMFLTENKSQIIFKIDEIEFSIRLLEGPYPDYKRILPDSAVFVFEAKKKEIEEALKVANTFARGNLGNKTLFDLDLERSKVKLSSSVLEIGENEAFFEVSNLVAESDLNTAYNLRFIQDIVSHIKSEIIRVESKGPLAATVFKDKNDQSFLHLLMPLRRE